MKKKSIDNKNKTKQNEAATKNTLRKWKNMLEFFFW